jgi:hypothetical protein
MIAQAARAKAQTQAKREVFAFPQGALHTSFSIAFPLYNR